MKKVLIVLSFFLLLSSQKVSAQEQSISVSPPRIDIEARQGGFSEGFIKVRNRGSKPLSILVSIQDFVVKDSFGTPVLLPENTQSKYSASEWISLFPESFEIQTGAEQTIYYSLSIPQNASPGGHYASIILKPEQIVLEEGSRASVTAGVGSLLSIKVAGVIKESAEVKSFQGKKFLEYGPVDLQAEIRNESNTHISPLLRISFYDMLGRKIEQKDLVSQNIFPESSRMFEASVGHRFMIGKYKASLLGSYGKNNNLPLASEFTFWVFPWRIALLITLLSILGILSFFYWKRRKTPEKVDLPKAPIQE